jgi:CDP-diacylglycerol--glycerol-3-phosphate 3-phosphatidyltransferase
VNAPTLLVVARAVLTVPVCALLAVRSPETDLAALGLFVIAAATDAVDGPLARARGQVTARGAAIDPLADKILVVGTLSALAIRGLAPLWTVAVVLLREAVAVWTRGRAQRTLPATADAKLKTILQMVSAAGLISAAALGGAALHAAAEAALDVTVALTVFSGVKLMLRATQTRANSG